MFGTIAMPTRSTGYCAKLPRTLPPMVALLPITFRADLWGLDAALPSSRGFDTKDGGIHGVRLISRKRASGSIDGIDVGALCE